MALIDKSTAHPSADLKACVAKYEKEMRCNCDLDNWQPERDTGHSWVCRIHKAAKEAMRRRN